MKKYLTSFFEEFEYDKLDSAELLSVIAQNKEVTK